MYINKFIFFGLQFELIKENRSINLDDVSWSPVHGLSYSASMDTLMGAELLGLVAVNLQDLFIKVKSSNLQPPVEVMDCCTLSRLDED